MLDKIFCLTILEFLLRKTNKLSYFRLVLDCSCFTVKTKCVKMLKRNKTEQENVNS